MSDIKTCEELSSSEVAPRSTSFYLAKTKDDNSTQVKHFVCRVVSLIFCQPCKRINTTEKIAWHRCYVTDYDNIL